MSINTNFPIQETQITRIAKLACQGYSQSAVELLNQNPLTVEQNEKITNILNQGPASDNLPESTAIMKASIVSILNGEDPSPGPGQQAITLAQRHWTCLPTSSSFFYLNLLPADAFQEIALRMDLADCATCSLVCKQWHQIFNGDPIWRDLLFRDFPYHTSKATHNFRTAYQSICSNFSHGISSQIKIGYALPTIADGKAFSIATGNTIVVWDLKSGRYITDLKATAVPSISKLCIADGKLFAYGQFSINIWDLKGCQNINTYDTSYLFAFTVADGKFFKAHENEIHVCDVENGECIANFPHQHSSGEITSLVVANGKLFSACTAHLIKVWDLESYECIDSFGEEHNDMILSLTSAEGKLFSSSKDNTIKIWDLDSFLCIQSFEGCHGGANSFAVGNGMLFSATSDSKKIQIWNLKTSAPIATLEGPDWFVCKLTTSQGKLFSRGLDRMTIWDFTADHPLVFEEIATALLVTWDSAESKNALVRFSKMPQDAQNAIFGKLYEIIKPELQNDYWGCAEHAFFGQHGQSATPEQKAQAIRNYLAEQRSNNQ